MANEFNDDFPNWESDYKVSFDDSRFLNKWVWTHVNYDGPEDDRIGCCATEQEAWDDAYEHWLEQRD